MGKEIFRSHLDQLLIKKLHPLLEHGTTVYVPFFANTFPLAFHYACLLETNPTGKALLNSRVKFVSWAESDSAFQRSDQSPLVHYSTCKTSASESGAIKVEVTVFEPKWIFSEFNLKVWVERLRILNENRQDPDKADVEFSALIPRIKDISYFEIFTELPEQANALFREILKGRNYNIVESSKAEFILPDAEQLQNNTLRLFLYGGPLTSYFRRKRQRYIPFKVGQLKEAEPSFRTVVVVRATEEAIRRRLGEALHDYHDALYSAADEHLLEHNRNGDTFRAVQYSYNRIARLLQHRSSFLSSFDYAECLREHHHRPSKA